MRLTNPYLETYTPGFYNEIKWERLERLEGLNVEIENGVLYSEASEVFVEMFNESIKESGLDVGAFLYSPSTFHYENQLLYDLLKWAYFKLEEIKSVLECVFEVHNDLNQTL
jgi:hypothetical protein